MRLTVLTVTKNNESELCSTWKQNKEKEKIENLKKWEEETVKITSEISEIAIPQ